MDGNKIIQDSRTMLCGLIDYVKHLGLSDEQTRYVTKIITSTLYLVNELPVIKD